jgi:hypothetical protein
MISMSPLPQGCGRPLRQARRIHINCTLLSATGGGGDTQGSIHHSANHSTFSGASNKEQGTFSEALNIQKNVEQGTLSGALNIQWSIEH